MNRLVLCLPKVALTQQLCKAERLCLKYLCNGGRAESSRQSIRVGPPAQSHARSEKLRNFDAQIAANANEFLEDGRNTFRFDTFGDEAFWGGALQLHQAIKGASLGGVGPGISPTTALGLGLKVDLDALPQPLINKLKQGKVDLNDPATTVALLKLDAVVGLKGFFEGDNLNSIGITCEPLQHSLQLRSHNSGEA